MGTVEEQLAEVRGRVDRLGADVSGDWATFAASVEAELCVWDAFLERLQAGVVERAWRARVEAEAAIADVRGLRIAVGERLAEVRGSDVAAAREAREQIVVARDELERRAAELSTRLSWREQER